MKKALLFLMMTSILGMGLWMQRGRGVQGTPRTTGATSATQGIASRATSTRPDDQGARGAELGAGPAATAPLVLTPESLQRVLLHISLGQRLRDAPEYRQFVDAAALNPSQALALIKNQFDITPDYDVKKRSMLFGLLIETTLAVKSLNGAALDGFLQEEMVHINLQLAAAERVEVLSAELAQREATDLAHLGPYVKQDGKVYASTFQAKLMALAVLKEAGTEQARFLLSQIAENSSVDPQVRHIANVEAQRTAN
jgi:hypothetical protein